MVFLLSVVIHRMLLKRQFAQSGVMQLSSAV